MTTPSLFDVVPLDPAPARTAEVAIPGALSPVYNFEVLGTPAPQGSKKGFVNPKTQRVVVVEQLDKRIKSWRSDVRDAAMLARREEIGLLDQPLVVDMVFTFLRPKSHYRTGKNAAILRDNAPLRPMGMPDLSKLVRSTEDALTGVLWRDDARITEYGRLLKTYAYEDRDALDVPGAVIRIFTLEPR